MKILHVKTGNEQHHWKQSRGNHKALYLHRKKITSWKKYIRINLFRITEVTQKLTIFRGNVKEERSWCIVAKKHSGILNHPPILSHLPDCWQPSGGDPHTWRMLLVPERATRLSKIFLVVCFELSDGLTQRSAFTSTLEVFLGLRWLPWWLSVRNI